MRIITGTHALIPVTAALLLMGACTGGQADRTSRRNASNMSQETEEQSAERVDKTDAEWREELTEEEYNILRQKGTEPRYSGRYVDFKKEGTYHCAGCGNPVFSSETKYDSETGWPSFWRAKEGGITTRSDNSWIMKRTEVVCARCDGHLGHVFEDGPKPTGLRYCINSAALDFSPAAKEEGEE